MPTEQELTRIGRELFECLMNRIYNVDDFVRLAKPQDRERRAIDAWLDAVAPKEDDV